jgi:signal transduction histidine kinase
MTISDNGIGTDQQILENSTSMGLFGMRERARQCNGTLEVEENRPNGTTIKVYVPTAKAI